MPKRAETEFTTIRLVEDQPIDELERDHLGLMPWAKMIAGAVVGTPGPFTIGVHGQWGYGKTTLLRLTEKLIERHYEDVVTVWFNAWQFEQEEHPLFPLVAAIADEIERKTKAGGLKKLKKIGVSLRALMRGMKFQGEVGMPLVGKVGVEFDAEKALEAEELLGKQTDPLLAEMLYHSAFKMLEKAAREGDVKIAVFVDDLDRCHPDKALFLLEGVKLILAQPGFVFVLALDRPVIESYLEKRYAEKYGLREGNRGRFFMEKIIQLPIQIPSHRTRFESYVARVVEELAKHHGGDSEPIKALTDLQKVIATGAGTNPRSLIRLVNNFLLDCTLWPLIPREGEGLERYQNITGDVAAALAFNRILDHELGDLYDDLIGDQELCNAILDGRIDEYAARAEAPEEPGAEGPEGFPRPRVQELSRARIAWTLLSSLELLEALREHGQAWLRDEDLRRAVHEFAQTQRAEAGTVELPEPLAGDVRKALGIGPGEPIPANRLAEVKELNLFGMQVTDAGLEHLKGLSGLQRLNLSNTQVTDAGLEHLRDMPGLQRLYLSGTQVTDAGLECLKGLSGLQDLYLSRTRVSDAGIEAFSKERPKFTIIR